jgi:hypothetical protein
VPGSLDHPLNMSTGVLRKIRRTYEQWILLNTDSVRYIETLLKSGLFFLPGRFKEQELTSELGTKHSYTSISIRFPLEQDL